MEPQTITFTPDPLPLWRRILGRGRRKADVQRDLEQAVRVANANAELADKMRAEAEEERRGRLQAAEERAKLVLELKAIADRTAEFRAKCERDFERRRNVSWPKPERRMTDAQLRDAFNVPVDEPLFQAVMQKIDGAIQEALDVVSQPPSATLTEQHRLHLAGGIEHLRLLQKDLLDVRDAAERNNDGEEGDE